jgi:2,4-dienoyl-CoA reductase-like NADH-dependent reductase (Old Yellow Enzyme family)
MPSEDHAAYHEERARGGVGLIVFESQAVHPSGKMSRHFVNAWDPKVLPMYRKITDGVHRHGAKIFGQLTHGGHTSLEYPPPIMWAPSQMPEPSSNFSTKAMDEDDIRATIEGFAVSAKNAMNGGFDGVEVKVAHDGLLRSFASPHFNHRTDKYGGSFENRMRLSVEVFEAVKEATSDDFPVGVRICLHEYTAWGYELDYGLRMAEHLEKTGVVNYFNCDAGSFSSYYMEIPPFTVPQGYFREFNARLKKNSDLPVVAFGRIKRPDMAEEILANGEADLIGMARQLIADPNTLNKLREGQAELIRYCIGSNDSCIHQVGQQKPIRCDHNPAAGRERKYSEWSMSLAKESRSVVVVGGGPVGLKVAEIAARRGHRVTLFERNQELGGQVRLASRQPLHGEIFDVVAYLEKAVEHYAVEVKLGVEVDAEELARFDADDIVMATGSQPNLPPNRRDPSAGSDDELAQALGRHPRHTVPGLDLEHVFSSEEVLSGAKLPGNRVLVVDGNGHWEGTGTAEYLAEAGYEVEVISVRETIGSDLEGMNRHLFYERAAKKGMKLTPFTGLVEVEPGRAKVKHGMTQGERWIELDAVVPVIGRLSREDLFLEFQSRKDGVRLQRAGDCIAPRLLGRNITEAYFLSREL